MAFASLVSQNSPGLKAFSPIGGTLPHRNEKGHPMAPCFAAKAVLPVGLPDKLLPRPYGTPCDRSTAFTGEFQKINLIVSNLETIVSEIKNAAHEGAASPQGGKQRSVWHSAADP